MNIGVMKNFRGLKAFDFVRSHTMLMVKILGVLNIFCIVLLYMKQKVIYYFNVLSMIISTILIYIIPILNKD